MTSPTVATSASRNVGGDNRLGRSESPIPDIRMIPRSPAAFMATEMLQCIVDNSGSPLQCTVSQDLQSFFWVTLYAAFKHAVDDITSAKKSGGTTHGIPGLKQDLFEEEFRRLFGASSAIGLAEQREAAFKIVRRRPIMQGATRKKYPLTYAGIENLVTYLAWKDLALSDWISFIWGLLHSCEPLQDIRSTGAMSAHFAAYLGSTLPVGTVQPSAAASLPEPPDVVSSDYAKRLDHAEVIKVLRMGSKAFADAKEAAAEVGSTRCGGSIGSTSNPERWD